MDRFITFNWEKLLVDIGVGLLQLVALYIVFIIVKAAGNKLISSAFERYEARQNVSVGRAQTLASLTKNVFTYVLIFVFFVTVLQIFGIQVAAILAGAGIVGLAVGFGAQGLVSDVVTGFFILLEKQMDVGDYVTSGSFSGIVEQVGLKTTHIRGFDGTLHYIPNRDITALSNHSRGNMRALIDIGISYDDNIDHAISVMQEACNTFAANDDRVVEGPNVVGVQSLGASDVVIRIISKTQNMEQWAVERDLRKVLKETLDANGIEIPFPHQVFIDKSSSPQQS